tara:strand:- start:20862 stop:21065 length:204 start_codon:yes stop_codon:yes gene_type:complete
MGFVKNIVDGYGNFVTGKTIPEEKGRIRICKSCKFYKPGTDFWCGKCPCHMKSKVKSPGAKCAIKKW